MLIWRRWRHLFVWIGTHVAGRCPRRPGRRTDPAAAAARRWRSSTSWHGFAMPSRSVAVLAATLVNVLYALVPAGQAAGPRQAGGGRGARGRGVRPALPRRRPPDRRADRGGARGGDPAGRLAAAGAQRRLPGHVPARSGRAPRRARAPRRRHRARAARPARDHRGRGEAVRPGGFGRLDPAADHGQGRPATAYLFGKLYAITHLRSDRWYKLGRTLLYGRLEDEKPFNTVRRLVQYEDYVLRLMRRRRAAGPGARTGSSRSPRNGSTCWSPSSSPAPGRSATSTSTSP